MSGINIILNIRGQLSSNANVSEWPQFHFSCGQTSLYRYYVNKLDFGGINIDI